MNKVDLSVTVNIRVEDAREDEIKALEDALVGIGSRRLEAHRDLVTVLEVTAATVALIQSLLELRKVLTAPQEAGEIESRPQVHIEVESGGSVNLVVCSADDLRALLGAEAAGDKS